MMTGWLLIYILIVTGLCWLALRTSREGGCAGGLVLLVLCFVGLWTIGRIIVNPENRSAAAAMLVVNAAAIITVAVSLIKSRK